MNNMEHRKLKVDTNLAVHAQKPYPLGEVVAAIERQVRNAQAFCRRGAVLPAWLPYSVQPAAAYCEASADRCRLDQRVSAGQRA
jgi:hypothetical protein